jgi:hypothetical protein
MMIFGANICSCGTRIGRSVLAALISFALVVSLFNCCCCFDGNEDTLTISVAQSSSDEAGKTSPCSAGAHCCHCLAHVLTMAPQDGMIASIEYTTRHDRLYATPAPDAVDLESPFKPPRA